MSLFGVKVDTWATGDSIKITTIVVQSVGLTISSILLFIRIVSIIHQHQKIRNNIRLMLLSFSQLLMMIFSCFYMFTHEWNYIHFYYPSNPFNCGLWYALLMSSLCFTRILLFVFLMLRSTFVFENSFCEISLKISVTMILITTIGNLIPLILIIIDFNPYLLLQNIGFCWRTLGPIAIAGMTSFHLINCVISIIILLIFYWKTITVTKFIKSLQNENKMNHSLNEINIQFQKHIKLGMLTIIGTIIMFIAQDLLSVLIGISFALDQTVNNILTFIMFKENAWLHKYLCCKCIKKLQIHSEKSKEDNTEIVVTNKNDNTAVIVIV